MISKVMEICQNWTCQKKKSSISTEEPCTDRTLYRLTNYSKITAEKIITVLNECLLINTVFHELLQKINFV